MIAGWAVIVLMALAALVAFCAGWGLRRSKAYKWERHAWQQGWNAGYAAGVRHDQDPRALDGRISPHRVGQKGL